MEKKYNVIGIYSQINEIITKIFGENEDISFDRALFGVVDRKFIIRVDFFIEDANISGKFFECAINSFNNKYELFMELTEDGKEDTKYFDNVDEFLEGVEAYLKSPFVTYVFEEGIEISNYNKSLKDNE